MVQRVRGSTPFHIDRATQQGTQRDGHNYPLLQFSLDICSALVFDQRIANETFSLKNIYDEHTNISRFNKQYLPLLSV